MSFKIAIASGKGGTGKTTVALNLYRALNSNFSNKVQLVDCDVEEPNDAIFLKNITKESEELVSQLIPEIDTEQCTFCKKCSEYCEFNAITIIPSENFAEVNASLCHSCGACVAACSSYAISEKEEPIGKITQFKTPYGNGLAEGRLKIGSAMQTMVIAQLKKRVENNSEVILYDAPPGTSCPVVETISDVNYVVLVTEPTPFGLYDMALMVDLLKELKIAFGVVVNKAGLGNNSVYEFIKDNNIELLGEIPFDESYASNYAIGNLFCNTPAAINNSLIEICDKIKFKAGL